MYSVTAGKEQFQPIADKMALALDKLCGEGTPIGDMLLLHVEMLAMLNQLEWSDRQYYDGYLQIVVGFCPVCGWKSTSYHKGNCKLAALIIKASGDDDDDLPPPNAPA